MARLLDTLLPLTVAALIFLLSVVEPGDLPPLFPHADKLMHGTAYAALAFLTLRALWHTGRVQSLTLVATITGVALYGGLLEWVQHLLPFRSTEGLDLVANLIGAMLGCSVYVTYKRRLAPKIGRSL